MYLNCHSYYSLRYGTIPIERLIEVAKKNNVPTLALTDINNTMGTIDFVKECKDNGIKPIAGIEFRNKNKLLFTGIAINNKGFRELNDFLTWHNLNDSPLPPNAPVFNNSYVIYPFNSKPAKELRENEFTGIKPNEIKKIINTSIINGRELRKKLNESIGT